MSNLLNNRYEIKHLIAEGGFGEVFLAKDHNLKIDVALKRFHINKMKAKLGGEARAEKYSLLKEIQRAIRLEHNNIVRYYDVFKLETPSQFGTEYYEIGVMEYIPDGTIDQFVRQYGINSVEVENALKSVLNGIIYLHQNEIIHRDIKASNVLMSGTTPKIIDFGISKSTNSSGNTDPSLLIATPEYQAPEQIDLSFAENGQINSKVDIWQFGVMLYYLCTNEYPFGKAVSDVSKEIIRSNILGTSLNPQNLEKVPEKYRNIVQKCLSRKAADRPSAQRLLAFFDQSDTVINPPPPPGGYGTSKPNPKPNFSWISIIGYIIFFVFVLTLIFKYCSTKNAKSEENKTGENTETKKQSSNYSDLLSISDKATYEQRKAINDIFNNMVVVKGGTFMMGCMENHEKYCSENEIPAHQVTVGDFKICKYEVTQSQWVAIMGKNRSYFSGCDECPIENINFNEDVKGFIDKISELAGVTFRLPFESEWEYAARAGENTNHVGSNDINQVAWYSENSGSTTHPVGQLKPNRLGLYDMNGNVWEFCEDFFQYYSDKVVVAYEIGKEGVVRRGGSWFGDASENRTTYRREVEGNKRSNNVGFRLAL